MDMELSRRSLTENTRLDLTAVDQAGFNESASTTESDSEGERREMY